MCSEFTYSYKLSFVSFVSLMWNYHIFSEKQLTLSSVRHSLMVRIPAKAK